MRSVGRSLTDALDNLFFFHRYRLRRARLRQRRRGARGSLHAMVENNPQVREGDVYIAGPEARGRSRPAILPRLGLPRTRVFAIVLRQAVSATAEAIRHGEDRDSAQVARPGCNGVAAGQKRPF